MSKSIIIPIILCSVIKASFSEDYKMGCLKSQNINRVCLLETIFSLVQFELARELYKRFPPETCVKHGRLIVHWDKEMVENPGATTVTHANRANGFENCYMKFGNYDGRNRDDYF